MDDIRPSKDGGSGQRCQLACLFTTSTRPVKRRLAQTRTTPWSTGSHFAALQLLRRRNMSKLSPLHEARRPSIDGLGHALSCQARGRSRSSGSAWRAESGTSARRHQQLQDSSPEPAAVAAVAAFAALLAPPRVPLLTTCDSRNSPAIDTTEDPSTLIVASR